MILVLILCAGFWILGAVMKVPAARRLVPIAVLLLGVLIAHGLLPADHPLPRAIGGSFAGWATLLGALALGAGYALGLRRLRARAPAHAPAQGEAAGPFSDTELDRYARHIVLREIGGPGQVGMKGAKVLVIGAGGLGAPALLYLAAAGVGTIGVVDDDVVENANLQRQVIHRDADIGTPKVFSAEAAMRAQNPAIEVRPYHRRLDEESAEALFAEYDIILDGTDNFETRYLANRVAARLGKPLIGGALSQWEGQLSVWDPARGAPCYACVFPEAPAPGLAPSCAEAGVVGPLPGVVGAMMALEAVKEITGAGQVLRGRMMIFDGLWGESRIVTLTPRPDCPVCGAGR